jgi:FKBP-type peptidyl-prolyl cis-trans isomerase
VPRLALALLLSLAACVRASSTPAAAEPSTIEPPAEAVAAQTVAEPKPERELAPVAAEQVSPLAPLSRFAGEPIASETREGGLEVIDYATGEGFAIELDDYVEVHYVLTLADGRELDSSHGWPEPFKLVLGETAVIPGFTAGLVGAKRGMLRKIVVPPALGYGERELAHIPPNSTLIFHVQVMSVSDW